jgi:plastocyanin
MINTHPRHLVAIAAALFLALPVLAGAPRAAEPAKVTIRDFAYGPSVLTIRAGMTVTWINRDDEPHVVTSTTKAFRSGALDTGQSYSFRFAAPGTYHYFCSLHPHMTGTIRVLPRS